MITGTPSPYRSDAGSPDCHARPPPVPAAVRDADGGARVAGRPGKSLLYAEPMLPRIDLRGRAPQALSRASLRGVLPRAVLDVAAATEQVRPVCEDVRRRGARVHPPVRRGGAGRHPGAGAGTG